MKANIIQIGNSKGVILPSGILRKLRLSVKSALNVTVEGERIILQSEPRQGWAEAAMRAHADGDDKLLMPDVFEDEDLSDIPWK